MIDTGASNKSTVGYGQYQAYNAIETLPVDLSSKGEVKIKFGIGSTSSIGSIHVNSPIGTVEFHVVYADTPFLLSLADMDRLRVKFDNLTNTLITPYKTVAVIRQFGHPFMLWHSTTAFIQDSLQTQNCYLTESELRRLYRRFGHPSVYRLQRVLERSGHDVDV